MADQYVDPRIYGGSIDPLAQPILGQRTGAADPATLGNTVSPVEVVKDTPAAQVGLAEYQYQHRDTVSYAETAKAAASKWLTSRMWATLTGPSNLPDPGFAPKNPLEGLEFAPNEDEREFLFGARNVENRAWRIEQLNQQHKADQAIADNPAVGTFVSLVDPTYFAIDALSFGAGRAVTLARAGSTGQRIAAGGASLALTYGAGKLSQGSSGMSEKEVLVGALLNGAMGAAVYREGKLVPKDAAFPEAELRQVSENIVAPKQTEAQVIKQVEVETKEVAQMRRSASMPLADIAEYDAHNVGKSTSAREMIKEAMSSASEIDRALYSHMLDQLDTVGDIPVRTVPKSVAKRVSGYSNVDTAVGFYDSGRHMVVLLSDAKQAYNNASVLTHEVAHALTAMKVKYGMANPETAIGKLTAELEQLRNTVINSVDKKHRSNYFLTNTDEFIAGIFSGEPKFHELLHSVKLEDSTVLHKIVDVVRKVLGLKPNETTALLKGIGLSSDLMEQRLTVNQRFLDGHVQQYSLPTNPVQARSKVADMLDSDKAAHGLAWNLYKTASRYSDTAKRIMRDLVDDPIDMSGRSATSEKLAIRADMHRIQSRLYDATLEALERRGFGLKERVLNHSEAMRAQRSLEQELTIELANREAGVASVASPEVRKMADQHVELMQAMLDEMKAAGVHGAEGIKKSDGYFPRHWEVGQIERAEQKLVDAGLTPKAAEKAIVDLVAKSMRDIEDSQVRHDIAKAIIDRAKRKGYFEDSAFRGHIGNDNVLEIRQVLEGAGLSQDRVQRVLDTVSAVTDEAGKASELKRRVSMDMSASIVVDGQRISVVDLVDSNILSNTDRYINKMSGQSAMARRGMHTATDIANVRKEYLHSIANEADRAEAAKMFDDIIKDIQGIPSGEQVPELMRTSQQLTQMVGLAGAGVWQITDYAKMMQRYGIGSVLKYAVKELPSLKSLLNGVNHDKAVARELQEVLTANANYDLRMKPFLQRMEDNFDIPPNAGLNIALQHHKQLVPYINGMKFVHAHQARIAGNLVTQELVRAITGDATAAERLSRYGLMQPVIDKVKADVAKYGMDTAKWSDSTWREVRGPLGKMMDEAVLKSRTGEVPYFAQFSALGKFVFTFRGFTLAAHNKLLAGTLGRDGYAGLSKLMLYQYPLAVLATAANNTIQGKKPMTEQEMLSKAVGQVGALGLYSELWNLLSGETTRASSPGFIALDRMYQVGNALKGGVKATATDGFSLDQYGQLGGALLNSVPLVASFGPTKALAEHLKGD